MKNRLTYFGYGANAHPEMMESMVGRALDGEPATLSNFELVIQQPHEIPETVKEILKSQWSPEEIAAFETYAIRRKLGSEVIAMAWEMTPLERELVDNWELNDGLWYQKTPVQITTPSRGLVDASTEIIDDPSLTPAIELHPDLPVFVNSKDRMLEVARNVRAEYLNSRS